MDKRIGILALALAVGACSTPETPSRATAVPQQAMEPGAEPDTFRYVNPNVDLTRYNAFLIDPVTIYNGPDANFSGISEQDKRELAAFMREEFVRVLSQKSRVATQPGPGVMRVHLTLAGVETTRPGLSTVTHLIPVGLAVNLLKGGTGGQGSFMGSATIAADFYDSATNEHVASVVTRQHPNAMDVTTMMSGLGAARAGITEAAEKFASAVDKIRHTGRLPAARG